MSDLPQETIDHNNHMWPEGWQHHFCPTYQEWCTHSDRFHLHSFSRAQKQLLRIMSYRGKPVYGDPSRSHPPISKESK